MKKFFIVLSLIIVIVAVLLFMPSFETKYLRIHIRANSNSIEDTSIKHEIKDVVCEYLTPLFVDCNEIEKAKQMLRENTLTIAQIADALAFDTPNYFTKTFKKITGSTPSAYKKMRKMK